MPNGAFFTPAIHRGDGTQPATDEMEYQPLNHYDINIPTVFSASTEERRCKSASQAQRSNHDPNLESTQYELSCITLPGQLNLDTVHVTDNGRNSEFVGAAQNVTVRCKSASHAERGSRNHPNIKGVQDCVSLSGQMNLDTVTNNIKPNVKSLSVTATNEVISTEADCSDSEMNVEMSVVREEPPLIAIAWSTGTSSQKWEDDAKPELESCVSSTNELERETLGQSSKIVIQEVSSQCGLSNSPLIVDGAILEDNCSPSVSSSSTVSPADSIAIYKENLTKQRSTSSLTKSVTFVLYLLCAMVVYPILLSLIPFLLMVKLVSLLCCCIPCLRRKHNAQSTIKHDFPNFFISRPGGYHIIGIELKQQLDGETFVKYMISKLHDCCGHDDKVQQGVAVRLASVVRWIACFPLWELREHIKLDEHIHIVSKRIITTTNLTDFIEQFSRNESTGRKRLWQVYFFPFFKIRGSCVVLRIHHSLLVGIHLKDMLIDTASCGVFNVAKSKDNFGTELLILPRPGYFETALTAPGVILKHLLRPSLSLLRNSNRFRYIYSSPMYLSEACHIANECNVSLHSVFMAALSQSLRTLFPQKYPFGRIKVAIPVVSFYRHISTFFVNLPLTKQPWDIARLQDLEKQIYNNSRESHVLLSAAKLASFALSPCTVNFLTASILSGTDVLFHVVHCSLNTQNLDDYAISSIIYWPPLFNRISIGVTVVVYEQSFRICIVTDCSVTDWPDILLNQFVAYYSELYRSLSV